MTSRSHSRKRHSEEAITRSIAERLRIARLNARKSQQDVAGALGITFQQVQKYERGTNRVSSSTLFLAAEYLNVDIRFFFDGVRGEVPADAISSTPKALSLGEKFSKLPQEVQQKFMMLVEHLDDD